MTKAEQLKLLEEIGGNSAGWFLKETSMLDMIGYFVLGIIIAIVLYIVVTNYKLIVRKIALFVLNIIWTVQAIVELSNEVPEKVKQNKRQFFKNLQ